MSRRSRSPNPLARLLPALLAAAVLAGCGSDGPPPEPPLPESALEAVVESPGVEREKLARKIDALFTAEGIGETRAVIVMHRGEVVAERYAEGFGPGTRFIGWSLSKTVTGLMIGALVAEGQLALDESPPIPRWQRSGDPRGEITIRQLLQMRSGLRHAEASDPVYESPEVRMMFLDGRDDMAAWAQAQPLEHEPGAEFDYSTNTSVILADVAARVLAPGAGPDARREAVAGFLESRLATPMGAPSFTGEFDAQGTMLAGSNIWATARDWAKLGELLRNGGSKGGVQLVPRSWVDFMRRPSPRASDYGAHLWLNRASGNDRTVLWPAQGPDTAFAAVGHLGQYVVVSPEQGLTVVRLGKSTNEERDLMVPLLAELFALYPLT
ncbi:serine hydrolase domain-containing protein [Paraurantiacibacter namhicola]|uniref:6-aminohexanoate-dimer hydrolase n=1 Tax=Paraurantiacibacter namhicola TaxID=645517 RepID=A0A1C7D5F0_9SPHN|nr:serine hydrolase [Paraurantiacibacter namhicola]ANU06694.1 6-aminohexanoate-dimer hydrolase [Paraurantiacibacter namhicola]